MKKIDKIIKNTILGGNMKKILFLAFLMSLSSLAFAASLDINSIGLHGSGGLNDFVVAAGETVTCIIDYSQTDCGIDNVYAKGTSNYRIMIYYYNDDPPTDANYATGRYVTSADISNINDNGTNHLYSFDFVLPSLTYTSVQVRLGLAGSDVGGFKSDTYSDEYMSYVARDSFTVPTGSQPSGCRGYLSFDSTTDAFESADFTNPANSSKQNSTVDVTFHLDEAAKDASVQIWLDDDATHTQSSEVDKIITLISEDQSQNFELDGSDLSTSESHIESITDNTSDIGANFEDTHSYYMAIRYQDSVGNPEAVSDWIQFTYDTSISAPTSVSATDQSGSDIDIDYTLSEAAGDHENTNGTGEVIIVVNDTSDSNVATVTLENSSIATAASHTITLDGSDLSASSYFIAQTGSNSLSSGTAYRFLVRYYDVAGNGPATSGYSEITYTTDSSTTQPTMDSASQNAGDHEFTFQFDLPEDALDNSVKIFIDTADDHDGSEGQIQLAGTFSADNDQTVTLSLDTSTNKFDTNDGDIDSIANDTALSDGTTYYVSISYQDASGNPVATSSETVTFAPDLLTDDFETSDFSAPSSNENATINLTFSLDEAAKAGSVTLYLDTDNNGTAEGAYELASSFESSGSHSVTDFNGGNLTTSNTYIDAINTDPEINSLATGNSYSFRIGYKDTYGNAEQTSDWRSFTYDTDAPTISSVNITDESSDSIYLDYTLSEQALDNKVIATIKNSDGTSTISVVEMIGASISSGATHNDVGLHGNALGTNGDGYTCTVTSGATSLSTGTTYRIYLSMTDEAGNAPSTSVYDSFDYLYDSGTEAPTMSSASELADANGPKLRVSYNLPEDGTNETVKILICNTNDSSDVHTTVTLEGHNGSGDSGNIDLDLPFATTDSDVYAVSTTTTLTNGTTYYAFVQYQDTAGNVAATSATSQSFTWDSVTQTATVTSPTNDSYYGPVNNPYIGYNLGENALSGSIHLLFYDDASKTNLLSDWTLTGGTAGEAGSTDYNHTYTISSAGNATADTWVNTQSAALTNGTKYYVFVNYQDVYYNAAVTSTSYRTFTFDNAALTPSITNPAASSTVTGDFTLTYNNPEKATDGTLKITFTPTAGTGTEAILTMNSTYCGYSGARSITIDVNPLSSSTGVTSVSGAASLANGTTYTIKVDYNDLAGNVATQATQTGITYSTSTTVLHVDKTEINSGNPLDGNATGINGFQPITSYKVYSTGSTCTLNSIKLYKQGTNVDADFDNYSTDAFRLYKSSDSTLDSGDSSLGSKANAGNWTWSGLTDAVDATGFYLILATDISAGFVETHTLYSLLNETNDITQTDANSITCSPATPNSSELKDLDGYVTIAGGDYGDAVITPGTPNNPFFTFHIKSNQGSTTMSQVDIALSGSVVSGDFPSGAFQLYKDTDSNFDGATAIGSSLDFASTLSFSGLSENITTTYTYYFLTCDVNANANSSHNIWATLTASDSNPTTGYVNILDTDAGDISGGTHTLPVELSSFNITNTGRKVILAWTTQTETENQGFNIFRGISENDIENSQAMKLNKLLIPGAINSTQPTDYMFYDDKRIEYGTTYYYWIQTVDLGGYTEFSDPVSYKPLAPTDSHDIPGLLTYGLHTNYPNPFNPETTISFVLDKSSEVTLDIYNIKGQKIKSLYHDNATSGKLYKIVWNGKNDQNKNVASGVYFYRLKTAYSQYQKSMLLLK